MWLWFFVIIIVVSVVIAIISSLVKIVSVIAEVYLLQFFFGVDVVNDAESVVFVVVLSQKPSLKVWSKSGQ